MKTLILVGWILLLGFSAACLDETPPELIVTRTDSADQMLFGLEHTVTVDGVLRAHLSADTAYLYESQQIWELRGNVVVDFFDELGAKTSTITSEEGTYNIQSTDMEARGNVVGSTPDGRRLTTTRMLYQDASKELVGPEPFHFTSADEDMRGASFRADPDFTRVRVTDVSGTPGINEPRR